MLRFWVVPIILWAILFVLFWNVKSWKWSVTKTAAVALLCALLSAAAVAVFGFLFIHLFD